MSVTGRIRTVRLQLRMADAQVPGEQRYLKLPRNSRDLEALVSPARLIAAAVKESLKASNSDVAGFNGDVEGCHAVAPVSDRPDAWWNQCLSARYGQETVLSILYVSGLNAVEDSQVRERLGRWNRAGGWQ